jgi:hypothetical protein
MTRAALRAMTAEERDAYEAGTAAAVAAAAINPSAVTTTTTTTAAAPAQQPRDKSKEKEKPAAAPVAKRRARSPEAKPKRESKQKSESSKSSSTNTSPPGVAVKAENKCDDDDNSEDLPDYGVIGPDLGMQFYVKMTMENSKTGGSKKQFARSAGAAADSKLPLPAVTLPDVSNQAAVFRTAKAMAQRFVSDVGTTQSVLDAQKAFRDKEVPERIADWSNMVLRGAQQAAAATKGAVDNVAAEEKDCDGLDQVTKSVATLELLRSLMHCEDHQ